MAKDSSLPEKLRHLYQRESKYPCTVTTCPYHQTAFVLNCRGVPAGNPAMLQACPMYEWERLCPECGVSINTEHPGAFHYLCGTIEERDGRLNPSNTCYRNQVRRLKHRLIISETALIQAGIFQTTMVDELNKVAKGTCDSVTRGQLREWAARTLQRGEQALEPR